ncbi:MAG: 50S ribosomal protein L2 [Alphaproteobacteria bacterium]|nr:MAG: 50S ribosomal protein L2 [Alphaproteobacteria bacterium]
MSQEGAGDKSASRNFSQVDGRSNQEGSSRNFSHRRGDNRIKREGTGQRYKSNSFSQRNGESNQEGSSGNFSYPRKNSVRKQQITSQKAKLRRLPPTTPGQRGTVLVDKRELWKGKPHKSLVRGVARSGGRNSSGKLTVRYIGGGHKKVLRDVSFYDRSVWGNKWVVERFEYDPARSAFLSLVKKHDDENIKKYVVATANLVVGSVVEFSDSAEILNGNATILRNVPSGVQVHSVELSPGNGAAIARSAGTFCSVLGKEGEYTILRLVSGEKRKFLGDCKCVIGSVSNEDHKNRKIGKAGRNRWRGIKPHVRGVAMNPVDHPHGGGEGKTSGGRHPCSPWGLATKGKKTRPVRKHNKFIIERRKK